MAFIGVAAIVCFSIIFFLHAVARPLRTIVPLYALTLPVGSVIQLSIPLPSPFNTLSSLMGALTIAACLVHVILYERGRVPTLPVAAWMLFLGWSVLSIFWAAHPSDGITTATIATPLILLVLVVGLSPAGEEDLRAVRLALILGGAAVGAYALYLLLSGSSLPTHGVSQRLALTTKATETDPNILAASMLLPLALSVERLVLGGPVLYKIGGMRALAGVAVFLDLVAIGMTGSRGGTLAAIAVFILALAFAGRLSGGRRIVRRVMVCIVGGAAIIVLLWLITSRVSPTGDLGRTVLQPFQRLVNQQQGTSGRTEIWAAGYLACLEHCEVGVGLGGFPKAYTDVYALSGVSKNVGVSRPAHNVYLSVAVETGFIGLILFASGIALEWRAASNQAVMQASPGLKPAIVGLLVASIFLSAIWFKYFWLLFVVIRVAEGSSSPRGAD